MLTVCPIAKKSGYIWVMGQKGIVFSVGFQYNKNNCKAMKGGKAPFWPWLQNVPFGVGEVLSKGPHGQQQNTKNSSIPLH